MNLNTISNNKLTLLRKLNQKKYRQKEQLFLAEGRRAVEQIIANSKITVRQLFFDASQKYWEQQRWVSTISSIESAVVDAGDFAEVSDTDSPQGVLALCEIPGEMNWDKVAQSGGLLLATDAIQDPGNLGTMIRTAGWFGIQGLLSGKGTGDLFHPKVVRSTAGAIGMVPHANVELNDALSVFENKGWQIVLLDAGSDSATLREIKKRDKMIVVIGNEANGIQSSLFTPERQKALIPSPKKGEQVESLNAAIATSIALYVFS